MSTSSLIEQWHAGLLRPDCTIQDAIRNLVASSLQISMVVNQTGVLVGTVTDGDIRRGLLRGLELSSPIDTITFRTPLVVPPQMGREMVLQLMHANKIRQLPIVDGDRRVVGLHLWDEVVAPTARSNRIVIMAGGEGRRLLPHTEHCPKPMLRVGEKPILEHIIERATADGFNHFTIAVLYLGHIIEDHFGDGVERSIRIDYVREPKPLGTAGALSLLEPRPTGPFVVLNGDVLTDIRLGELLEFHSRHAAVATMAVRQHEWQHPFGVVRTNGVDIVGFEEKPVSRSHINAGVYVLDPEALDALVPGEHCDMPSLFLRLQMRSVRTIVYPMHEPWLDVGRPADLARAEIAKSPSNPDYHEQ